MTIASGLTLMGRSQAEALMESTCVITRITGETVNNDGSTTPTTSTIYTGKCRFRFPTAIARAVDVFVEGQSIVHQKGVLSLPVIGDSGNVRVDDLAVVALNATLDPGATVTARIEAPFTQTHSTARRFPCEVTN